MPIGTGASGRGTKEKKKFNPVSYDKAGKPSGYKSTLGNRISSARNNLLNFKYDPMQDASYQALAQIYGARGKQAAQDTLGEAAALNGGYGTSYAVSAAQQARNQYNQELASLVPDLEANAYARAQTNYNVLVDRDNELYNRYRDRMADYQWRKGYNADIYQFKKNYALQKRETALAERAQAFTEAQQKKNSSGGGGGGGRRRRGGGSSGGYSNAGGGGLDLRAIFKKAQEAGSSDKTKKKKTKTGGGGGHMVE